MALEEMAEGEKENRIRMQIAERIKESQVGHQKRMWIVPAVRF